MRYHNVNGQATLAVTALWRRPGDSLTRASLFPLEERIVATACRRRYGGYCQLDAVATAWRHLNFVLDLEKIRRYMRYGHCSKSTHRLGGS